MTPLPKSERGPKGDHGQQGDTGSTGLQGKQGIVGETGDTGLTGDVGRTGQTGDTGERGEKGTSFSKGQVLFAFLFIVFCVVLMGYRSESNANRIDKLENQVQCIHLPSTCAEPK